MIKTLLHRLWGHKWVGLSYANIPNQLKATGTVYGSDMNEMNQRLLFGFTIILLICKCGNVKRIEVLGIHKPERSKSNAERNGQEKENEVQHST